MSQDRLSYEERNRQREERVIEHERALNESRRKAKRAPHGNDEDPEALLKAQQSLKLRRAIAIIFAIIALIGLFVGLSKKSSTPRPVAEPSVEDSDK